MNDERVICPECEKGGQRSRVTDDGMSTTLMGFHPYHDEDGRRHVHDPNRKRHHYACSRGHRWEVIDGDTCWCGWRCMYARSDATRKADYTLGSATNYLPAELRDTYRDALRTIRAALRGAPPADTQEDQP